MQIEGDIDDTIYLDIDSQKEDNLVGILFRDLKEEKDLFQVQKYRRSGKKLSKL